MDASGAAARPTGPLDVGSPEGSILEVNGGLRWPPLLLVHGSHAAPLTDRTRETHPESLWFPRDTPAGGSGAHL